MNNDRDASVYLPQGLKAQIIETAQAEGYTVCRGRRSRLTEFIALMLKEHNLWRGSVPRPLRNLAPSLLLSVTRLGDVDTKRQERASAMLDVLLEDWQEQESRQGRED